MKPGSVKPPVKMGKAASVLRKRPTLSPIAKAGVGVLVLAIAVGGFFSYRIFFPAPSQVVVIKSPPIAKPKPPDPSLASKVANTPSKLIDSGQNAIAAKRAAEQAKLDAMANLQDAPTPVPTETELIQSTLTKDVKVNNTPVSSNLTATAAFKAFVADAAIGGVFQGKPSKALINGRIAREGQVVDSELGIVFDRIDAEHKVIFFKDATGAEVSKNY